MDLSMYLSQSDLSKELQRPLIAQPDKGDLIQGTGGLRKIRMALGNQGKAQASRIARHEVADVKAIRAKLNVSQVEFAEAMGTSVDTVKSWETKRRNPTGLAAKVLAWGLDLHG